MKRKRPLGDETRPDSGDLEARRLSQELEAHKIELETQNAELQAAHLALEALLERYTELFDFAPLGYAVVGPDDVIREINHAGAQILREYRARLSGCRLGPLVTRPHRPIFASMLGEVAADGAKRSCEVDLWRGDGTVHVRFTASLLGRDAPTVLLAFEDVTERKLRDDLLRQTEAALREANRGKDQFLAMLSHELRNPLGPLRSSAYLLRQAPQPQDVVQRASLVIDRQVSQLSRIVDDLLEVTRIGRGKIQLRTEPVDLGVLVGEAMEDHRPRFEGAGIRLESDFEPGPFSLVGDRARLIQVLSNVLDNSEKFTATGGRVSISLRRVGASGVVTVRDTGVGIAAHLLPRIFEPFMQAPQTLDRPAGGLGLGLAIVKGFVELHGGTVEVASEGLGMGAEVTVSLPLEPPPGTTRSSPGTEPLTPQPGAASSSTMTARAEERRSRA
jgi:signal transduction histidine kinase